MGYGALTTGGDYAQAECVKSVAFTMAQRVNQAVAAAEQRLKAAQRARQILDAHPDIEELINLLGQF